MRGVLFTTALLIGLHVVAGQAQDQAPAAAPKPATPKEDVKQVERAFVEVSRSIPLLGQDVKSIAEEPLAIEKLRAREAALNAWFAFKACEEVAGPWSWPTPSPHPWPEPIVATGLGAPNWAAEVQRLIPADPSKAWTALWTGVDVPPCWKTGSFLLIGEAPRLESISDSEFRRWESVRDEVLSALSLPQQALEPASGVATFSTAGLEGPLMESCQLWNQLGQRVATVPDAPSVAEALSVYQKMLQVYQRMLEPIEKAGEQAGIVDALSSATFQRQLDALIKAPLTELQSGLAFEAQFAEKKKALAGTLTEGIRQMRSLASTLVGPDTTAEKRAELTTSFGVQLARIREALWGLASMQRTVLEVTQRKASSLRALRQNLSACRDSYLGNVTEAQGMRLGFETRAWDSRKRLFRIDLSGLPSVAYFGSDRTEDNSPSPDVIADSLNQFWTEPSPVSVSQALVPTQMDESRARVGSVALEPDRLSKLVEQALANGTHNFATSPLKIEMFGHRLRFDGAFVFPQLVPKQQQATHVLVVANEVVLSKCSFVLNQKSSLIIIAHRLECSATSAAIPGGPPTFVVNPGSKCFLFVTRPATCPKLAFLASNSPQQEFLAITSDRSLNPWASLLHGNAYKAVTKKLDEFWITTNGHLLEHFLTRSPLAESEKQAVLREMLDIPKTVCDVSAAGGMEQRIQRECIRLFSDRILFLPDPDTGAQFPCFSVFESGRHEVVLLPDRVGIDTVGRDDGLLGSLTRKGGKLDVAMQIKADLSTFARRRASHLIGRRFPEATVREFAPKGPIALAWSGKSLLSHAALKGPPRGNAVEATELRTGELSEDELRQFLAKASGESARGLLFEVDVSDRRLGQSLGSYPLRFGFGLERTLAAGEVERKDPNSIVVHVGNEQGRFPFRLVRVFSRDGAWTRAPRSEGNLIPALSRADVEIVSPEVPEGLVEAEFQYDYSSAKPADLFLSEQIPERKN